MVDLLVDVNRENLWIKRLKKIRDDWKEMAEFKWHSINRICEDTEWRPCRELPVKEYKYEHQKLMIECQNKFNRAFCKFHSDRRLSTSHLKESHDINLNYEIIEELLRKNEWEKLNEFVVKLRNLELEEKTRGEDL